MSYKTLPLLILLLFIIHYVQAQEKHKDDGYLIYTLGTDTTMIGHYRLNGDDFEMTVLIRPGFEVHKLKGSLFPSGECKYVEGYAYRPVIGKDSLLLETYKLLTRNDSTFTEFKSDGNVSVIGYSGRGMIHLGISPYIFFTPLYAQYAPVKAGDSTLSSHFIVGYKFPFTTKRINKNFIVVVKFFPYKKNIDIVANHNKEYPLIIFSKCFLIKVTSDDKFEESRSDVTPKLINTFNKLVYIHTD